MDNKTFYKLFNKVKEILNDLDPNRELFSISFSFGLVKPVIEIRYKSDNKIKVRIGSSLDEGKIFIVTEASDDTTTTIIQEGDNFENIIIEKLCSLI